MIQLIPAVKKLELTGGNFSKKGVFFSLADSRLAVAAGKLPQCADGAELTVTVTGGAGEGYELWVRSDSIEIRAENEAGAFYAIQTLRQLFAQNEIPCLHIQDAPDFPHRGFYHDVTRGKVPTVASVKALIDDMAYYKLNSLQLYVEHTYPFAECEELAEEKGHLTAEELRQIGAYCQENFIDFIPSLSTFGHLFELLNMEKHRHLQVLHPYTPSANFWRERMAHHTIDPRNPQSLALIQSLIDQYAPNFDSETFNICCDETFDLKIFGDEAGKLYVDFVKKIIDHVKAKGKKVMMWADILLKYPQVIGDIPEDIIFLNWNYNAAPPEGDVVKFKELGRKQIVCPGTTTWNRFCERVDVEEKNISLMAEYGYKHGALGVLNTNWGDWGNPCSVELAMYGMVLGAEKSWSVATPVDEEFYARVDQLLYGKAGALALLKKASTLHDSLNWRPFVDAAICLRDEGKLTPELITEDAVAAALEQTAQLKKELSEPWEKDEYRKELLLCVDALAVMAQQMAALAGLGQYPAADTEKWLSAYTESWLKKNKPSELKHIQNIFRVSETIGRT